MHKALPPLLLLALIFLVERARCQAMGTKDVPDSVWEESVSQGDGKAVRLGELTDGKRLTVLLFLGADCPLSQKAVTEAVGDLEKAGGNGRVGLLGLLVSRDDALDIDLLRKEFRVRFPLLLDGENRVARKLGVKVVPTAVLLDMAGKVLYQGRINDRVEQLGKRSTVRRHDLREALLDALAGKPPRVARTEAVGCPVETRQAKPGALGTVEYHRDIQPILYRNCVACHQRDGVGPFPLVGYEDATLWLETGMALIERKLMPPGQAESDFAFANPSAVPTPRDLELIGQWLKEGMPRGKPPAEPMPIPVTNPEVSGLGKPDFVLKMDSPMTIGPVGDDLYRFLVFKLNQDRELKFRAVRMIPGNRKVVHHTLIWHADSSLVAQVSANKTLRETELLPGDKGPGFGQSEMLGKFLAPKNGSKAPRIEMIGAYVPGAGLYKAPEGHAITLPMHSDLVVQMHYHRTGKEEVDDSSIALYLAGKDEHPDKAYLTTNINDEGFLVMPPNQRKKTQFDWPVEEDCEVVTMSPHGHFLTLSQTFTLVKPDGQTRLLLHVPAFDFNWQRSYTYKQPIPVTKGSFIRVSALVDNTSDNPRNPNKPPRPVYLGENTNDEMVFPFLSLIVPKNTRWNLERGRQTIWTGNSLVQTLRKGFGLESPGQGSAPTAGPDGKLP